MHVPALLATALSAATTAQARHMRATTAATKRPQTTPTPQRTVTRAPDPNKALPHVYTVSVSAGSGSDGSGGGSTTVHCDNVLCTNDRVWCWYWGGITGYDVGLGPLPGETITVLGACSDYDDLGEDYEEAEFEW
ncbi:hypothetical protein DL764_006754 [Monosporascus ibericus]|uniref:Uncharacterized protein n=1 Tax=Monosporascus ibericus TaxID=155417 RepID=A0A4Q4T702_9PEZI|nr:hypothetical protein DL764_006754 [Monosporascus ibericus]